MKRSQTSYEMEKKEYNSWLTVHQRSFSGADLIVNPKNFPTLKVGDILQIFQQETRPERTLYLRVDSVEPVKGNLEISVLDKVADHFRLQQRQPVTVRVVPPDKISIHAIELSFRNQYIGRSDMWRIKDELCNSCVYTTKSLKVSGMRMRVDEMSVNGVAQRSGLITADTKFTWRSKSARLFLLIQLSEEMWSYADDGELYFEKVVGFLKVLFSEWQALKVSHLLSIILFSRTFIEPAPQPGTDAKNAPTGSAAATHPDLQALPRDVNGRHYQDHYKVLIDGDKQVYQQWDNLLVLLKTQLLNYHQLLKWGVRDEKTGLQARPSPAHQGNILEAINCAVSVYDKHFIDRDLNRTGALVFAGRGVTVLSGQNIVILSAGTGVYWVDRKLGQLTKQRMVDGGIGCDLICMTRPPLHAVPLFCFQTTAASASSLSPAGTAETLSARTEHKDGSKVSPAKTDILALPTSLSGPNSAAKLLNPNSPPHSNPHSSSSNNQPSLSTPSHPSQPSQASQASRTPNSQPSSVSSVSTPAGSVKSPPQSQQATPAASPQQTPSASPAASPQASPVKDQPAPVRKERRNPFSALRLTFSGKDPKKDAVKPPDHPPVVASAQLNSPPIAKSPVGSVSITLTPVQPGGKAVTGNTGTALVKSAPAAAAQLVQASTSPPVAVGAALHEHKDGASEGDHSSTLFNIPHWIFVFYYDHQDLFENTPFGFLMQGQKLDPNALSRKTPEYLSLSACRMFDKFDFTFRGYLDFDDPQVKRDPVLNSVSLVPFDVAHPTDRDNHELQPPAPLPTQPSQYDAYDASVFDLGRPIGQLMSPASSGNALTSMEGQTDSVATDRPETVDGDTENKAHDATQSLANVTVFATGKPLHSKQLGPSSSFATQAGKLPLITESGSTEFKPAPSPVAVPGELTQAAPATAALSRDKSFDVEFMTADSLKPASSKPLGLRKKERNRAVHLSVSPGTTLSHAPSPSQTVDVPISEPIAKPAQAPAKQSPAMLRAARSLAPPAATATAHHSILKHSATDSELPTINHNTHTHTHSHNRVVHFDTASSNKPAKSEKQDRERTISDRERTEKTEGELTATFANMEVGVGSNTLKGRAAKYASMKRREEEYANPFMKVTRFVRPSVNRARWVHLYNTLDELRTPLRPNWKSLCKPAILPLTTDYFPPPHELKNSYVEYNHELSMVSEDEGYQAMSESLLKELICLREAQDYQIIVTWERLERNSILVLTKDKDLALQKDSQDKITYYFSRRNQLHRVTYDKKQRTIQVKRYVHRRMLKEQSLVGVKYKYYLWTPHTQSFVESLRDIEPNKDQFDWNYADNLIAGHNEDFIDALKYRRVRYAIIPNASQQTSEANDGKETKEAKLERDRRIANLQALFKAMLHTSWDELGIATRPDSNEFVQLRRAEPEDAGTTKARDREAASLGFATRRVRPREKKVNITERADARAEWFRLQYDALYDPSTCFHMEVWWLVATGSHVHDWITKNFQRKAKSLQFNVVRIPTNQPHKTGDPFHAAIHIPLASPKLRAMAETYLLTQCNFVLDAPTLTRRMFMHQTGMALIRSVSDGFVWVDNPLSDSFQYRDNSVRLFQRFSKYCNALADVDACLSRVMDAVAEQISSKPLSKAKS